MSEPLTDLEIWPLFGLELITPRLTLQPIRGADVFEIARTAALGVHDPDLIPFRVDWAGKESPDRERGIAQYLWSQMAGHSTESWNLGFGVWFNEALIGTQELGARHFGDLRQVQTGSWLAQPWQGKGYGKEMRRAVLDLAFIGLGAEEARSGARVDNPASLGVSEALGYRRDGTLRLRFGDQSGTEIRLLMTRETWLASEHEPTRIRGLTPAVRAMLGA